MSNGVFTPQLFSIVILGGAISIRRISPALSLSLAWLAAVLQMLFGAIPSFPEFGILMVLYASTAYGTRGTRRASGVSALIGTILASAYLSGPSLGIPLWDYLGAQGPEYSFPDFRQILVTTVTVLSALLATLLAGLLRRSVLLRYEQNRARELAEIEVLAEQERTRIARDMHDVVAHSLTVMVAQADGARYLVDQDQAQTKAALEVIASTAREALAQVRVLLAELRHRQDPGPQPELDQLHALFEQFRVSGLVLLGTDEFQQAMRLKSDQQRALYRILQEALTNALRHGILDQPVHLTCREVDSQLEISIRNSIAHQIPQASYGHGLIGMTERAALVGAQLKSSAHNGIFEVHLVFPEEKGRE
ncbi:MAG: histidine kinase [Microbacteriaceae bacterium]